MCPPKEANDALAKWMTAARTIAIKVAENLTDEREVELRELASQTIADWAPHLSSTRMS